MKVFSIKQRDIDFAPWIQAGTPLRGVAWFTGLSGSGKTTIASALVNQIVLLGHKAILLDADRVRKTVNKDLGYSLQDRKENIRRIAELANMLADDQFFVCVSCISPLEQLRAMAKNILSKHKYYEFFIDCPLEICEQRDPKLLYHKFRNGELSNMTGIDSPYEIPTSPDLVINTSEMSPEKSTRLVLDFIQQQQK